MARSAEADTAIQPGLADKGPQGTDEASSDIVQWFLDYYWIRHAISPETLAAYRSDLLSLELWLGVFRHKSLVEAGAQDLRDFLDVRHRTASRPLGDLPSLSCIKRFYFFLVSVGVRSEDPTETLYVRAPKVTRQATIPLPSKQSLV